MIVLGLISGTSVDAIDVAAADFSWRGRNIAMRTLGHAERPWPAALRARLLGTLPPAPIQAEELCRLDVLAGEAFAGAAAWADETFAAGRSELVGSHGQTVFHWVRDGGARGTLQIGQPAAIVERTGLPVISDFRARDIAAGGQGAPLASTLDALWLAGAWRPARRAEPGRHRQHHDSRSSRGPGPGVRHRPGQLPDGRRYRPGNRRRARRRRRPGPSRPGPARPSRTAADGSLLRPAAPQEHGPGAFSTQITLPNAWRDTQRRICPTCWRRWSNCRPRPWRMLASSTA